MRYTLPLSEAKANLSKVVRDVRSTGASVLITVDGEPAARVEPVARAARPLSEVEISTYRALSRGIVRDLLDAEPFDAVDLIREGRR